MSVIDYSKFDRLNEELDIQEKKDAEREREESRMRYEKDRKQKQLDWENKMRAEGKDVEALKKQYMNSACSHTRMRMMAEEQERKDEESHSHDHDHDDHHHHDHSNDHSHSHSHDHSHHHHSHDHSSGSSSATGTGPKSAAGMSSMMRPTCGFMTPEQLKEIERQKLENPPMSTADKNKKKTQAVHATREDGNRLFGEGKYKEAFSVYERGVLIINGMYGTSEEEYDEMEQIEALLDLNMAYCKLKMEEPLECINLCKMCLAIDNENPKAYYRIAEAYIAMGEFGKAKKAAKTAAAKVIAMKDEKKRKLFTKSIRNLTDKISKLSLAQKEKDLERKREMAHMMQQKKKKNKTDLAVYESLMDRDDPYAEEDEVEIIDAESDDEDYEEEEEDSDGCEADVDQE